jgi:hypothetical protein
MQSEQEFDVVGRFNQAFDVEKVRSMNTTQLRCWYRCTPRDQGFWVDGF